MANQPQQKKSAKGQKIGRHSDRSPSAKAYRAGNRLSINQKKRAKRHARRMARIAIRAIEYRMRHGLTTFSLNASRLTELRQVIAQNH